MSKSRVVAANRRASRRQQIKKSTKVICQKGSLGLGPNLVLSALDLSENGIRLLSREALDPPQGVLISLQSLGQRRPFQLPGDVIWCVPTADGQFCVGIRFEKPLGYGDLQTLVYS